MIKNESLAIAKMLEEEKHPKVYIPLHQDCLLRFVQFLKKYYPNQGIMNFETHQSYLSISKNPFKALPELCIL